MKEYYLIGKHLSHSYSKQLHNKRHFDYKLKEIDECDLECFIKKKDYKGLNVTMPYKEAVIKYLDKIDPLAAEIGSVNTIAIEKGKIVGYNSDLFGFALLLRTAKIDLYKKNVVILGSGGVAKTVCSLLSRPDVKVEKLTVVSRTGEINYTNYVTLTDTEIVINCTPVGMFPNIYARPIDLSVFPKLEGVVDLIYNPFKTALLQQAEDLKIAHIANGLSMFVGQAMQSENIWEGANLDVAGIEAEVDEIYKANKNIVFVGMPGAGKSSYARALGEYLNREVADTDEMIEQKLGLSVEDIIRCNGIEFFREEEKKVVYEACTKRGVVIAVGGGAVLSKENRILIRSNARVVYLTRDLDKLPTENRPLSKTHSLKEIYEERKGFYESIADEIIDNNGAFEDGMRRLKDIL